MNKPIDIFLKTTATTMGWHTPDGYQVQALPAGSKAFAKALVEPETKELLAGADVDLYLAEDLLFFTKIFLPLQTPDIKKAIALQLDMLSPYGEESLFAFAARRHKEGYSVTLYCCRQSQTIPFLEILFEAGAHLTGLYPESQRYLTRANQKLSWSLWSPGRFGKITHFNKGKVISRDLCAPQVDADQIKERTNSVDLYALAGVEAEASPASSLLDQPAAIRAYNMLPASFRRPDYMKKALLALAAANLIFLLLLGGGKGLALYQEGQVLDQQIEDTRPEAEQARQLKAGINKLHSQLEAYHSMGSNIDLIAFMDRLSQELPATAYLEQLRLDQPNRTITLQGYTDDLPELTAKIPDLGAATLKSTMQRRNMTYFHLEVTIP